MALDPRVQKSISVFVEKQFPELYREEGPKLVEFLRCYFEWMEEQGPLYDARRLPDYRDIDTVPEKFIVHFASKYLKNIQLQTVSDTRLLVKHSLDVYRSRGTPRAIDLLFRLVFGVGTNIYYPGLDLFRLSDGKWSRPIYLEVALNDDLTRFNNREIVGLTSGAKAFVERVVRRKTKTRVNDLLYVSALQGHFQTGEYINVTTNPFSPNTCPQMTGSLTDLEVVDGSNSFVVGDVVSLMGEKTGWGGKARVTSVQPLSGAVSFNLIDGGYGFRLSSNVLVSSNVLSLSDVQKGSQSDDESYFWLFDQLRQPLANLNYINANGHFQNNDIISTYYANNTLKGRGTVLSVQESNSTAGQLFVYVSNGNLSDNTVFNAGNAVAANLPVSNGYIDKTATGNCFSESNNITLSLNNLSGVFRKNEVIFQGPNLSAATWSGNVSNFTGSGLIGTLGALSANGLIDETTQVSGFVSGATANVSSLAFSIGVIDVTNQFIADDRAPIVANGSLTTADLNASGTGSGAGVGIQALIYPETIQINDDLLLPYMNVAINSSGYGFPALPSSNLATIIAVSLTFVNATVGAIASLGNVSPGEEYSAPPFVRPYEPLALSYHNQDVQIDVSNVAGTGFAVGEVVSQLATGARGLVLKQSNSSTLFLKRLSLIADWVTTSNSTTPVVGTSSGTSANVGIIQILKRNQFVDIADEFDGINGVVQANVEVVEGSVATLEVVDSGVGYQEGESVLYTSEDGLRQGVAIGFLGREGHGTGRYLRRGGQLSSTKRLLDSDYWQDFSYEVQTSIPINKYSTMLQQLLHLSGTRAFGSVWHKSTAPAPVGSLPTTVTVS